jgi:uncharacterized protein with PIN domain
MIDRSGSARRPFQDHPIADIRSADLKFTADVNLGTLARWLRILGYDACFDRGDVNRDFLRRAQQEDRIVLTRKRDMANRQFSGRLVIIEHDHVRWQLAEVIEKTGMRVDMERFYRRCARCNALLEKILLRDVEGLVPDYVYHQSGPFQRCPDCGKIYWPGAHRKMAIQFLKQHIPADLP